MREARNNMIKPRIEYENGKPILRFEIDSMPVSISFADTESRTDYKSIVLDILTEQCQTRLTSA